MMFAKVPTPVEDNRRPLWRPIVLDAIAISVLLLAAVTMIAESFAASLQFDELLTDFSAALATPQLIWHNLVTAPLNSDPPLYHFIEHYAIHIGGNSDLALRLPSMAGMLVSLWLVYLFARRIGDRTTGLLAMSIVMASGAFFYGYNARPYGIALMAAAGALVSWQNIVHGRSRLASLICFGGCLALADSVQYYSVLIFIPFAVGETIRAFRTRKIDWMVLLAMIAGNSVMLIILPFMPSMRAWQRAPWRGVVRGDALASYRMYFHSVRIVLAIFALLALGYVIKIARARAPGLNHGLRQLSGLRTEEIAALISFALYPLAVFAFSLYFTHTFAERFTLPAILGLSILLALAIKAVFKRDALLLPLAALILCVAPVHAAQSVRSAKGAQTRYSIHYATAFTQETTVFSQLPVDSKIVITDAVPYLRTMRYAPESVRRRITLLDLFEAPTRDGRKEFPEMIAFGIRVGIGLPAITPGQFNSLREPFFLVCCRSFEKPDERVEALRRNLGRRAVPAGTFRYWPVFEVQPLGVF